MDCDCGVEARGEVVDEVVVVDEDVALLAVAARGLGPGPAGPAGQVACLST